MIIDFAEQMVRILKLLPGCSVIVKEQQHTGKDRGIMDRTKTQFMMSEVRTYVTVDRLEAGVFGCTLNLVDFFEGDEVPTDGANYDLKIKQGDDGTWAHAEPPKVHLKDADLQRLGKAIEDLG